MKIRTFSAWALLLSLVAVVSCNKSEKTDETWKEIPTDVITVESGNAAITVNGTTLQYYGSAKIEASSATEAVLTLADVVPGYETVNASVTLEKTSATGFSFSGEAALDHPKVIIPDLKSESLDGFYALGVQGTVTLEGKLTLTAATKIADKYQAGLAGKWNVLRDVKIRENGSVPPGPLGVTWKSTGYDNIGESIAPLASIFIGGLVGNVLNSVSFLEDGNITAQYYSDLELSMDNIFNLMPTMDEEAGTARYGYVHDGNWNQSPAANLAMWYTNGDRFYVVPNIYGIGAVIEGEEENTKANSIADLPEIAQILTMLKELGVDVTTLTAEMMKIIDSGVALKYAVDGNSLKLYADKELCGPIIESFLPVLPLLDDLYAGLAESDPDLYSTLTFAMAMVGIEKPSDLATVWANTTEFEVFLNLVK